MGAIQFRTAFLDGRRSFSCPGRSAVRSTALQNRDPSPSERDREWVPALRRTTPLRFMAHRVRDAKPTFSRHYDFAWSSGAHCIYYGVITAPYLSPHHPSRRPPS
jgi:hypothetical protein